MRSTYGAGATLLLAVLVATLLASCASRDAVTFEPAGAPRTSAEVESAAKEMDLSNVASIDVRHAADRRTEVLVWLRQQGVIGRRAASLLTRGFPGRTPAVPVYVAAADVDGVRSLVVVEASGDATGALRYRRLWVFDLASGRLLSSASYR